MRIAACLPLALLIGAAPADPVDELGGRYLHRFRNGSVNGQVSTGENRADIIRFDRAAAYVRVRLDFYNGHTCDVAGIARVEGGSLVYRDREMNSTGGRCVLSIARVAGVLRIDDGDDSCQFYCGARGSLSGVSLPLASRRPIRNLRQIRRSREYRRAVAEWSTS